MGVLDLDSSETESANNGGDCEPAATRGDGTTTTTTFRSGHDEDDAASRSNTFVGMQAASLGPDPHHLVHRYRMGTGSL